MHTAGTIAPSSKLSLVVNRGAASWPAAEGRAIIEHGSPQAGLPVEVNTWRARNAKNLWRGWRRIKAAKMLGVPTYYGALYLTVTRDGVNIPYGLASLRVVTDSGVGYIVDSLQNLVEMENMRYHGFGTGGAAEAAANTALTTELTTQYAVDNTRPTGTQAEAAANIFRSVATFAPDSGGILAITEHGLFSQAATGGGVMFDRSLFSVVNVTAGADSITSTWDLTMPAGS
jgi:hypothetical protein